MVQYASIRLPSTGTNFLRVLVSHAWVNPGTTAAMASATTRHSFFFVMLMWLLLLLLFIGTDRLINYVIYERSQQGALLWDVVMLNT